MRVVVVGTSMQSVSRMSLAVVIQKLKYSPLSERMTFSPDRKPRRLR